MSNSKDFIIENGVLKKYVGPGGDVVIPDGVTEIGIKAFAGCDRISSVVIPEGVTAIGYAAFRFCTNLKSVTIPQGVQTIATWAFSVCTNLKKIVIPGSVDSIGDSAFSNCRGLIDVTICEGVKSIEQQAFSDCRSMQRIEIPFSVTNIGVEAFWGCKELKSITIPAGVTRIGNRAFRDCACDIYYPTWTKNLEMAIGESGNIRVHTGDLISEIPTEYRNQAVMGFITEKDIDFASVRAKSYLAFLKKNAPKRMELAFENPELLSFLCEHQLIKAGDTDAFMEEAEKRGDTEKKALLLEYQNKLGMEKVVKAREKKEKDKEDYADALVERLSARNLSKGIEGLTFVVTGKLEEWDSRNDIKEYLESFGAHLGSSITKKTDYLVTNDTDSGSEKNKKAKEFGALVIDEAEFNHMIGWRFRDAEHIVVPGWIKAIPKNAFYGCSSLTSITIPDSVTSIGGDAFARCPRLVIHAPAGSYAEQYAKENNIRFEAE